MKRRYCGTVRTEAEDLPSDKQGWRVNVIVGKVSRQFIVPNRDGWAWHFEEQLHDRIAEEAIKLFIAALPEIAKESPLALDGDGDPCITRKKASPT